MRPTQRITKNREVTHEGGMAARMTKGETLRRSVMACMLWEDTFYEDGETVYKRIKDLCGFVGKATISKLAIDARQKMHLRHTPLVLCRELARRGDLDSGVLAKVLVRADSPAEFLALLWEDGKCPVSRDIRRGIEQALTKWTEYDLAKYGRSGPITMRDIFRIVHPNPYLEPVPGLWAKVVNGELAVPDTWEVALSTAGKSDPKKVIWERLLNEGKLGGLALLRNLRNMQEAKVNRLLVMRALQGNSFNRVLPFRFLAAANAVPSYEPMLDEAMLKLIPERKLSGTTYILVDVSGSMLQPLSSKSVLSRMDAACGLGILAREMCNAVRIFSFSSNLVEVPARRGMSLKAAIGGSQHHGSTYLGAALEEMPKDCDRLIVITDEQSQDNVGSGFGKSRYMLNVGTYKNGVGYGNWTRINGFSEAVLDYIAESEKSFSEEV